VTTDAVWISGGSSVEHSNCIEECGILELDSESESESESDAGETNHTTADRVPSNETTERTKEFAFNDGLFKNRTKADKRRVRKIGILEVGCVAVVIVLFQIVDWGVERFRHIPLCIRGDCAKVDGTHWKVQGVTGQIKKKKKVKIRE
jgi:hypothetical protein